MIINEISRSDVIVGGDHGQGVFRFPMKMLFIMKCGKSHVRISNVTYILYKKDNGLIPKDSIIEKLQELFKLILVTMIFDNQQLCYN